MAVQYRGAAVKVDWKELARISRLWPTGRARDFPQAEHDEYRRRLGLPPTRCAHVEHRRCHLVSVK